MPRRGAAGVCLSWVAPAGWLCRLYQWQVWQQSVCGWLGPAQRSELGVAGRSGHDTGAAAEKWVASGPVGAALGLQLLA
ncbi:hypothetical protein CHLRE_14g617027v5 [Chlamydomonas reinhardtii]|uniref:Secreted protein n=1 Tax=Chlamydomonas reinhardtii TaxID=3055 RepID=A0A2K3CXN6_CHLRE|nr:uncharacterized protein CHLRE_14g617027v5 [Chlamydomonas reinhardtii]PNW73054.1 hypothetical protein CHLRE_14g617027v5 [Chlamydomonas reinhardtii]